MIQELAEEKRNGGERPARGRVGEEASDKRDRNGGVNS